MQKWKSAKNTDVTTTTTYPTWLSWDQKPLSRRTFATTLVKLQKRETSQTPRLCRSPLSEGSSPGHLDQISYQLFYCQSSNVLQLHLLITLKLNLFEIFFTYPGAYWPTDLGHRGRCGPSKGFRSRRPPPSPSAIQAGCSPSGGGLWSPGWWFWWFWWRWWWWWWCNLWARGPQDLPSQPHQHPHHRLPSSLPSALDPDCEELDREMDSTDTWNYVYGSGILARIINMGHLWFYMEGEDALAVQRGAFIVLSWFSWLTHISRSRRCRSSGIIFFL